MAFAVLAAVERRIARDGGPPSPPASSSRGTTARSATCRSPSARRCARSSPRPPRAERDPAPRDETPARHSAPPASARPGGVSPSSAHPARRDRRHEVRRRAHPAGGRAAQRVGPGREAERGRERAEVDVQAAAAAPAARTSCTRSGANGRHATVAITQARNVTCSADVRSSSGFCTTTAAGVRGGRDEAEHRAPARVDAAPRGRGADDDGARERDRAAREQRPREALAEHEPGEHRDEDRPELTSIAAVPASTCRSAVLRIDVVGGEPEQAAEHEARARRRAAAAPHGAPATSDAEHDARDEQAARATAGRARSRARVADGDERGRPQDHGDEGGGQRGRLGAEPRRAADGGRRGHAAGSIVVSLMLLRR